MSFVCPSWLSFILYNPVRKLFTDREKILAEAGVTADSVVLEIGAGNGFFTDMIARHASRLIAIELQEGMVRKLKERIRQHPGQVEIVKGDISLFSAENNVADVCLLYYSFHEVTDKPAAVANICSMLKKGGSLAIYEPSVEVGKKSMEKTVAMFENIGFTTELRDDRLFTRVARLRKTV